MYDALKKVNKVIILSGNTGQGHNSVAAAIKDELEKRNVICDIEDGLRFVSEGFSTTLSKGHSAMYRVTPKLFGKSYRFMEKNNEKMFGDTSAPYRIFAHGSKKLYDFIINGGYDAVLCTHDFPAVILSDIRKQYGLNIFTGFVYTDYCPYSNSTDIDLDVCFIPDAELEPKFEKLAHHKKTASVGIPVRHEFLEKCEKTEAKALLGINENSRHIIVMCGSMGCGPIKEIVEQLCAKLPVDAEATVLCGKNEGLRKRLCKTVKNSGKNNVHIKGFVDNVSLYMDSADIYITKPGGISVTEAAVKGLPMALLNVVSGFEEHNLEFFVKNSMAITGTNEKIVDLVLSILDDDDKLKTMSEKLAERGYGHAAGLIADYIVK